MQIEIMRLGLRRSRPQDSARRWMHPVRPGLEGIDVVIERMLLQSVSDGQISHDGNAEFTKMVGRTYA